MIKTIIVDDERKSREVLKTLLEMYCPKIEILATTADIPSSIQAIKTLGPDIVFLDISLKDGDSFMILDALDTINFNIIFITAFDEYSMKALNYSGIPCLFKPVDIDELLQIIENVAKEEFSQTALRYSFANHLLKSKFHKIPVLNDKGINLIKQEEIISVQKIDEVTKLNLENGDEVFSKRSFSKFLDILPQDVFFSISNELHINLLQVHTPPERFRNRIIMKNGDKVSLDKKKLLPFWDLYKNIG